MEENFSSEEERVLSVWEWVKLELMVMIPIYGIIKLISWGFIKEKEVNKNQSAWTRATVATLILGIVLGIVLLKFLINSYRGFFLRRVSHGR